jgi:GR25 family glycosyltransferase involved in LPS biosynthesis
MYLYVINLESEKIRWDSSKDEAMRLGLQVQRIDAVNANFIEKPGYVSLGVAAAWNSHIKALQIFLESDAQYGLIAEDDFQVENEKKFRAILRDELFLKMDLVQLGFLKPGIDTRIKVFVGNIDRTVFQILGKISLLKPFSKFAFGKRMRVKESHSIPHGFVADDCQPGAHLYIVSRNFATEVIRMNNPQFLSIDDFYCALSKMRTFKMIRPKQSIAGQKPLQAWEGARFIRSNW